MSGPMPPEFPADWSQLTPEQKREWRLDRWGQSAQHIPLVSPEAEARHKAKVERLIAVYNVEEPDRVPVSIVAGQLALHAAGLDYHCLEGPGYHEEWLQTTGGAQA